GEKLVGQVVVVCDRLASSVARLPGAAQLCRLQADPRFGLPRQRNELLQQRQLLTDGELLGDQELEKIHEGEQIALDVEVTVDIRLAESNFVEWPEHLPQSAGVFEDQREPLRLAGVGADRGAVPESQTEIARAIPGSDVVPEAQVFADVW